SNLETLTPRARSGAEAIPVRLDGQPSADDVARGAQVEVAHGRYDAAWIDAERTRCTDVEVLILDAKDHVDQRALVGHVVEAAARIPAAIAAHGAVSSVAGPAANTGDARAVRVLDMGGGEAPGRKDQQPVPGIAQSRARREQVDDLVLAEDIFFEALCDRQDAARAATFVGASAARRFRGENPRAPLPLRAGVDSEDGVVVAGRDVGSDGARRREMVSDVIVRPADVEADVSAGTNRSTPPEAVVAPCTASPPPLQALRSSPQATSLRERDFSCRPAPRAGCRRFSIALPRSFGCDLSATRNVIPACDARRSGR